METSTCPIAVRLTRRWRRGNLRARANDQTQIGLSWIAHSSNGGAVERSPADLREVGNYVADLE